MTSPAVRVIPPPEVAVFPHDHRRWRYGGVTLVGEKGRGIGLGRVPEHTEYTAAVAAAFRIMQTQRRN